MYQSSLLMMCGSLESPKKCISLDMDNLSIQSKLVTQNAHSFGAMVNYKDGLTLLGGRGKGVKSQTVMDLTSLFSYFNFTLKSNKKMLSNNSFQKVGTLGIVCLDV